MKIIIAPDSFKGSISSKEIVDIINEEFLNSFNDAQIIKMPMADGGEGSLEIIMDIIGGDIYYEDVIGPDGNIINASYGISNNEVAIIELAKSSGMYRQSKLNPMTSSTFGFGQLIKSALDKGIRKFILCLGGSASSDMGTGMANALGIDFYDKDNNLIKPCGKTLKDISRIDYSNINPYIKDSIFKVYCDVSNPLYGSKGAINVYARQKGANDEELEILEESFRQLSNLIDMKIGYSRAFDLYVGAAGGTGYGCMHFLNAELLSGIKAILSLYKYDDIVKDADLIISGEGSFDEQSFNGKVISGLMSAPEEIPIYIICGLLKLSNNLTKDFLLDNNINVYQLSEYGSVEDCIKNPEKYIRQVCRKLIDDFKRSKGNESK